MQVTTLNEIEEGLRQIDTETLREVAHEMAYTTSGSVGMPVGSLASSLMRYAIAGIASAWNRSRAPFH